MIALLSLDAKWIDRIQQVNAQALGQDAHQREDLIEIRFHLQSAGPVLQSLREFAVRNVAVRNEDDCVQLRRACVGRHGCRSVAGGDARHALPVQPNGLRYAARHAVVLERPGGIEALVLERETIQTAIASGARRTQQRRVAFPQRDHLMMMAIERQ